MILAMSIPAQAEMDAVTIDSEAVEVTERPVLISPLSVELYPGQDISASNYVQVGPYSSVSGEGKIIRVWYQNKNTNGGAARITLKKNNIFGQTVNVMTFTVEAGTGAWSEYTGNSGSQTYYVRVEGVTGASVKGYLRFVQDNTSAG